MIKALSAVEDDNQKIVRSKEDLLMLDFERKKSFYTFVSGKVSPFFKLDNEARREAFSKDQNIYLGMTFRIYTVLSLANRQTTSLWLHRTLTSLGRTSSSTWMVLTSVCILLPKHT